MSSTTKIADPNCSSLKPVLTKVGVQRLNTPIEFVHDDRFDDPNAVHEILESSPACLEGVDDASSTIYAQEFLLPTTNILKQPEEQALFLAMNCRLFLAEKRRRQALARTPTEADLRCMQRMLDEAKVCRLKIATANQRLVVSIAAKFSKEQHALSDLIGEGNLNLMKAIDLFDVSRGFRFSTYATYAISRHLGRIRKREWTRKNRWSNEIQEPIIEDRPAEWIDQHPGQLVKMILNELPPREQDILKLRFGLGEDEQEHTYEEIAKRFGISKERVRQLIVRACSQAKIRYAKAYGFAE